METHFYWKHLKLFGNKSFLDFIFLNDFVNGYKTSINKIVSVSYYANTALKPKLLYPLNFRILI